MPGPEPLRAVAAVARSDLLSPKRRSQRGARGTDLDQVDAEPSFCDLHARPALGSRVRAADDQHDPSARATSAAPTPGANATASAASPAACSAGAAADERPRRPAAPVGDPELRPRNLAAQDRQLVSKHEQLDVFHVQAAPATNKRTQQSPNGEVEEGESHTADPPNPRRREQRHRYWRLQVIPSGREEREWQQALLDQ